MGALEVFAGASLRAFAFDKSSFFRASVNPPTFFISTALGFALGFAGAFAGAFAGE